MDHSQWVGGGRRSEAPEEVVTDLGGLAFVIQVNLLSPLRVSHAFAPLARLRSQLGSHAFMGGGRRSEAPEEVGHVLGRHYTHIYIYIYTYIHIYIYIYIYIYL